MDTRGNNGTGRVTVEFTVSNNEDVVRAKNGDIPAGQVRSVKMEGVVDSGANYLVLPAQVVERLGLPVTGKIDVRYADRRKGRRSLADQAEVELLGRKATFQAIVEAKRQTALIGAIVLEALDLLIDSSRQRLLPRDPKGIVAELE